MVTYLFSCARKYVVGCSQRLYCGRWCALQYSEAYGGMGTARRNLCGVLALCDKSIAARIGIDFIYFHLSWWRDMFLSLRILAICSMSMSACVCDGMRVRVRVRVHVRVSVCYPLWRGYLTLPIL